MNIGAIATGLIEILKNLSVPFSEWWTRREKKAEKDEKIDRIKERDERRRKIDELFIKIHEEQNATKRAKLIKEYLDLVRIID